jgi:hypothetical protein
MLQEDRKIFDAKPGCLRRRRPLLIQELTLPQSRREAAVRASKAYGNCF